MQGRSRLIAGTASMGKSVDGEREAGGTDVKQWQAQMAYRAWRVEGCPPCQHELRHSTSINH
jgi:hypothetical protein